MSNTDIPRFRNPHVNTNNCVPNTNVVIDIIARQVVDDGEADDYNSALESMERISNTNVFEQDQLTQRGIVNSADEEANRPSAFRQWFNNSKII